MSEIDEPDFEESSREEVGESPGTTNCGGLPVVGVEHFGVLFFLGGQLP